MYGVKRAKHLPHLVRYFSFAVARLTVGRIRVLWNIFHDRNNDFKRRSMFCGCAPNPPLKASLNQHSLRYLIFSYLQNTPDTSKNRVFRHFKSVVFRVEHLQEIQM